MKHRVCPWWLGYLLACPLRRLLQDPAKLLAPYIRQGMTVLEPGPGMGFFTLELARLVGASGRVIAVDVQPKMVDRLRRRARAAGVSDCLDARVCPSESLGLADVAGKVDFTLAFAVVHEMPSAACFFAEVAAASKQAALLLLAEPAGHIGFEKFDSELSAAFQAGFALFDRPTIRRSRAALLKKT
jgi:SAM-dependent methyltransferase